MDLNARLPMLVAVLLALSLVAGCAGDSDAGPGETGGKEDFAGQGDSGATDGTTDGAPAPDYQVRVSYEGEWELTTRVSTGTGDPSSEVTTGTGDRTVDVPDDFTELNAKVFQSDTGVGEISIELIRDGEVVASQSQKGPGATVEVTERAE